MLRGEIESLADVSGAIGTSACGWDGRWSVAWRGGDADEWYLHVVSEMPADRAEQCADHAAVPTGADDDEVGFAGDVAQAVAGVAVNDGADQGDPRVAGKGLDSGQLVVHEPVRGGVVVPVGRPGFDCDRGGLPRVDERDGVVRSGMVDCPPQCGMGRDRAVDANGDPLRAMVRGGHARISIRRRLSMAELAMTDKLDSAMAAAAMIGFRSPAAAMGMAAAL
ncbi:MAG: hypothetical protein FD127_1206 [Acidimicrobiaceae bacterium]|nr:MAG: hypothetical protein FD127_1206 [Acidimicrobiaceae bacterium]